MPISAQEEQIFRKYKMQIGTAIANQTYGIPGQLGTGQLGTFTGIASPNAITNCKYFVMYFDTSIGGYKGTWWDTDEEAAEDVRKIQANNSSTHVVILTKDQEWLRTWERR